MKDWFAQLNQREQMSLFILSLAVGLYLLFVLLWSPLAGKRDALEVQNSAIAGSLARVDAMVSELLQLRDGGASVNTRRNLTSLINQSTSRMELQVSRLQPSSRGDIQVRLENAAFDDVLEWLHEMEYREGLLVREVSVTQAGSAGRVNATVRIAQAG
jgi:general secretion pathway protein M